MQPPTLLKIVLAGALIGLIFSGFSTKDFAEHLDRQEHSVHCSFVPGLAAQDATGASGCQVAMMSPYSSMLRQRLWGGVPIALPSMSVFAFLMFLALYLLVARRTDRQWLGFLALSTALPVLASLVMAIISLVTLGTLCKLCIGIYAGSVISFAAALLAWRGGVGRNRFAELAADDDAPSEDPEDASPRLPHRGPAWMFAVGILFVAAPVAAWVAATPEVDTQIADCGLLDYPRDIYGVMVKADAGGAQANAIEVLDPLCPACRAFDDRLLAAGLDQKISRQLVLVPLDNTCNWMVDSPVHPGACTVSEAVLCAKDPTEVLHWAFDQQETIREAAATDPRAARRMVVERFPELKSCVGSSRVRSQLNKSLRWAVRNRLPLFTPQLFIEGVKLCNEDIDLGLDYAVANLVERHRAGTLPKLSRRPLPPVEATPADLADAPEAAPATDDGEIAADANTDTADADADTADDDLYGDAPVDTAPADAGDGTDDAAADGPDDVDTDLAPEDEPTDGEATDDPSPAEEVTP